MHAFDANFSAFHSLGFFETGSEGSKRKKWRLDAKRRHGQPQRGGSSRAGYAGRGLDYGGRELRLGSVLQAARCYLTIIFVLTSQE